jgi:hypothetical protein
MKRLRLVGFSLFVIGSAVLIYLGIQFFALHAQYNSANSALELIGFISGLSGALLIQTQKRHEMKA